MAAVAAANAVLVVALVGFAPALPKLVGAEWHDVPAALLWSGIALILASPLVVSAAGFLLAAGMPGIVAVSTGVSGAVWLAVALPLVDPLGAPAVGVAWIASGVVNAILLWRPVAGLTKARIARHLYPITAIALTAAGAAWLVAHQPTDRLVGGACGLMAGEVVLVAGLLLGGRPALLELVALARDGFGSLRDASTMSRH